MPSFILTFFCSIVPFLYGTHGSGLPPKKYNFDLVSKNIAPDGFTRSAALVNGQFPGPVITATKGQDVLVTVNNKLSDPSMRRSSSIVRTCWFSENLFTDLLLALARYCTSFFCPHLSDTNLFSSSNILILSGLPVTWNSTSFNFNFNRDDGAAFISQCPIAPGCVQVSPFL